MRSLIVIVPMLLLALAFPCMVPLATAGAEGQGDGEAGWVPGFGNPLPPAGVTGEVFCSVTYQNDLVIAGPLEETCGVSAEFISRWDGTAWTPYAPGLGAPPRCLIEYQGNLVAGGAFRSADGQEVGYLAVWDGTSWEGLGDGLSGGGGNGVTALCLYNGDLIAAGDFDTAGGEPASRIARWDGSAWHPLATGVGGLYDAQVFALAVFGNDLIAGGHFTSAGDQDAGYIARWDGEGWFALGAGVDGTVRALHPIGSSLVVGGNFLEAGGSPARHVARWDGDAWSGMGPGLGADAAYQAVTCFGEYYGEVYAGGTFQDEVSSALSLIVRWDSLSQLWRPLGAGLEAEVTTLATAHGALYACGPFTQTGETSVYHIARWDRGEWSALCAPSPEQGIDGPVTAMASFRGSLFVGGQHVALAGATPVDRFARWNGSSWSVLEGILWFEPGPIHAMLAYDTLLYVAGEFPPIGGWWPRNLMTWFGGEWWGNIDHGLVLEPPPADRPGSVNALSRYAGRMAFGGNFRYSSHQMRSPNVTSATHEEWVDLGDGVGGPANHVFALASRGDTLYAGGDFRTAGGAPALHVAAWDGSSWSPMGSGVGPDEFTAVIRTLAVVRDTLFAGGIFQKAGGVQVSNIAKWDGQEWKPLGSPAGCDGEVLTLAEVNGNLIVGGRFSHAGGVPAASIAQWDGTAWSPLGSGTNGAVRTMCVHRDTLYVGGDFTRAGGDPAFHIARWTPAVSVQDCSMGSLTAGQSRARSFTLSNETGRAVTLTLLSDPEVPPFRLSQSFKDSLAGGVQLAASQSIRARAEFSPTAAGAYGNRLRFLLSPIGRELHVLLTGSARELAMDWTSRALYEPSFRIEEGDSVFVQITLGDSVQAEGVEVFSRECGAPGYQARPMNLVFHDGWQDRYEATLPGSLAGPRGLEFFMQAANGPVTCLIANPHSPIRLRVSTSSLSFPAPQPAESYRLWSVPLEFAGARILAMVGDDLGTADAAKWRMFSYEPDSSKYVELAETEAFLEQGRSYWLIVRDPVTLDTGPVDGVSTPADSAFVIRLKGGWNLIGNPFAFPVAWDSVRVEGKSAQEGRGQGSPILVESPVAWNGNEYIPNATTLRPFEGYWVYVDGDSARLRIPPIQAPEEAAARPVPRGEKRGEWAVQIAATGPRCRDTYNFAEMRDGALDGRDTIDRAEPPLPPGGGLSLYFVPPDGGGGRCAVDARATPRLRESPTPKDSDSLGFAWPFDVAKTFATGDAGDHVTLSFEWTGQLPVDLDALVIDRDLGIRIDPRDGQPYTFVLGVRPLVSDPAACRFVLLAGSRDFVRGEGAAQVSLPKATRLMQPGPNPASGPLTIRYDLARPGPVKIALLDLSGALIDVLWEGEKAAGRHQLTWRSCGDTGRRPASGVYFLRLRAGGIEQTRKVVLLTR